MYNPFGYTGEYTDSESGLVYLRARYYDPSTQQFLTVDPALASTEQAYAYVGGSPTNFVDATGQWAIGLCLFGSGGLIGIGSSTSGCLVIASPELLAIPEIGLQTSGPGIQGSTALGWFSSGVGIQTSWQAGELSDLEGPFGGIGGSIGKVPVIEPYGIGGDLQGGFATDENGCRRFIDAESVQL